MIIYKSWESSESSEVSVVLLPPGFSARLEVHLGHSLGGLIWWAEADEAKALRTRESGQSMSIRDGMDP